MLVQQLIRNNQQTAITPAWQPCSVQPLSSRLRQSRRVYDVFWFSDNAFEAAAGRHESVDHGHCFEAGHECHGTDGRRQLAVSR